MILSLGGEVGREWKGMEGVMEEGNRGELKGMEEGNGGK